MKKGLVGLLCALMLTFAAVPALAAAPAKGAAVQKLPQYMLSVNGKKVDLGTQKIVKIKNVVMVPLRITSEALGCTVTWDAEKKAVRMDDGVWGTELIIGKDEYGKHSVNAIGLPVPQKLGVAPTIIGGSAYIPVDFYSKVLSGYPVSIKKNVIQISSPSIPQKPSFR
ncbi:MAG: copper amine oxidase N-terminal domain-containing protein [Solirubrobacterales bacterium]